MRQQSGSRTKGRAKESRVDWRGLVSYRWLVRHFPYLTFLSLLAVIYIYNGHYADKTVRTINALNQTIEELSYEYKTLKGEVMFRSKQSEIARAVEPLGLKELVRPPALLQADSENDFLMRMPWK